MEGTFPYDQLLDRVMILAAPMTTPSQNNSSNNGIEEFVFSNPSVGSSFPHCYLSEALAPYYQNVASPDPASNNSTGAVGAKSDTSFSMGIDISQSSVNHSPSYGGTKAEDGSSNSRLTSTESMDPNVRRRKKQQREEAKRKQKEERRAKLEAHLEAEGYIHVRARRGQATDSHSLAERVRRKKLSERMTILESLVPGCDQVTGKAQVLDVIINYVQSLQNQIEFLSMKLASVDQCKLSEYSFDDQDHLKETQEIGGMTYEQVMSYGGFEQQNLHNNISEPQELDNSTTAFSQEVGSAILGQFSEAGQGLLDQIGLDWITSFDF